MHFCDVQLLLILLLLSPCVLYILCKVARTCRHKLSESFHTPPVHLPMSHMHPFWSKVKLIAMLKSSGASGDFWERSRGGALPGDQHWAEQAESSMRDNQYEAETVSESWRLSTKMEVLICEIQQVSAGLAERWRKAPDACAELCWLSSTGWKLLFFQKYIKSFLYCFRSNLKYVRIKQGTPWRLELKHSGNQVGSRLVLRGNYFDPPPAPVWDH